MEFKGKIACGSLLPLAALVLLARAALALLPPPRLVAVLRPESMAEALRQARLAGRAGFDAVSVAVGCGAGYEGAIRAIVAEGCLTVGASSVGSPEEVRRAAGAGARMVSTRVLLPEVIREASSLGLLSLPGVCSAEEARVALREGAGALKLFPAARLGPAVASEVVEVGLEQGRATLAAGGITIADLPTFSRSGVRGFLLGSTIEWGAAPVALLERSQSTAAEAGIEVMASSLSSSLERITRSSPVAFSTALMELQHRLHTADHHSTPPLGEA